MVTLLLWSRIAKPPSKGIVWLILFTPNGCSCQTLLSLPVAGLWFAAEPVLRGVGIEPRVAHLAGVFASYSTIWIWPRLVFLCLASYLEAQEIVGPQTAVQVVFVGINVGLNWLLVRGVGAWGGLGFRGSPIATALSQTGVLLVSAVVTWQRHQQCWPGLHWSNITRQRVVEFLKQGGSLAIGQCVEEWQIQLISGFAGRLGKVPVSAHNAMLETFFVLSCAQFGMFKATSVRIAMHLGKRNTAAAKRVVRISLIGASIVGVVVALVLVLARNDLGYIYSEDKPVVHKVAEISWLCGVGYSLLALFYSSMATLQGQSRSGVIAVSYFVGAWLISVPLAYVLGFVLHLGLRGLWYGMVGGYAVITLLVAVAVYRSDWEKCAQNAQAASQGGTQDDTSTLPTERKHTHEQTPLLTSGLVQ
eukprot:m.138527 g.138527  ORF g.138527 m.138527 type:complete len:418 (-) comp17033_c0_seq4:188-1441(-)